MGGWHVYLFLSLAKYWLWVVWETVQTILVTNHHLRCQVLELRSQLALYEERQRSGKIKKPRPTPGFRQLWVLLSFIHKGWKAVMVIAKPDTVKRWHDTAYKRLWAKKSQTNNRGRPPLDKDVIVLIRRLVAENPGCSEEKIRDLLILYGVSDPPAANSIRKYTEGKRPPSGERRAQTWRMFLSNHGFETWGMDFFKVVTLTFKELFVLVMIRHDRREIVHFGITEHPNIFWLKQQIREATAYGRQPKYLVHDNDKVFVSKDVQRFLVKMGITPKRISKKSPWQNPYAERVIGTLRYECLNYMIPFNAQHLQWILDEYITKYYNPQRPHQGLGGQTPIPLPAYMPTKAKNTKLIGEPILHGLYHRYRKIS